MQKLARALLGGFAGAIATNLAHEIVRRITPEAPRVDLLGMQTMVKMYRAVKAAPPTGRDLYVRTLIGDVVSNSVYFSLAALGGPGALPLGIGLGVVAGIGGYFVPEHTDLDDFTTARSTREWCRLRRVRLTQVLASVRQAFRSGNTVAHERFNHGRRPTYRRNVSQRHARSRKAHQSADRFASRFNRSPAE